MFEGAYAREVRGVLGFGPDPATFASRARFVFFEDGRFVFETLASGSGSGADRFSESRFAGSYTLNGYGLTLRYDDGTVDEQAVFIWSDTDNSILSIGGALYEHEPMPDGVAPGEPAPFSGVNGRVSGPVDVSRAVVAACPVVGGELACNAPNAATVEVRGDGNYALELRTKTYAVFAFVDADADGRLGGGDYLGVHSQNGKGASLVSPPAQAIDIRLEPLQDAQNPEVSGRVVPADGSSPAGSSVFACPVLNGDFACGDVKTASTGAAKDGAYRLELASDTYIVLAVQDANGSGELDAGDYFGYYGVDGEPAGLTPPAAGVDIRMQRVTAGGARSLQDADVVLR